MLVPKITSGFKESIASVLGSFLEPTTAAPAKSASKYLGIVVPSVEITPAGFTPSTAASSIASKLAVIIVSTFAGTS